MKSQSVQSGVFLSTSTRASRPAIPCRNEASQVKKRLEMATKVSNFSDLVHRVAASCLLHPLAAGRREALEEAVDRASYASDEDISSEDDERVERPSLGIGFKSEIKAVPSPEAVGLMEEVFEAVAVLKRAYARMQDAHSPWDPERMRAADVAVVGEFRRLGVLRERFRRETRVGSRGGGRWREGAVREVVAPYEAAVEELKRELKAKEAEIENLTEKLKNVSSSPSTTTGGTLQKGRSISRKKVSCGQVLSAAATPELFETTMSQVKETSKSFTSLLLTLMRAARWDIAAAVRSIEAASATSDSVAAITPSVIVNHHAKYALESYILRKIFQGFDHETFYMDGSLSSLLNPEQYRRDCFTQYRDMKAMDPMELLGILPSCNFGKFCSKKYLAIMHPKMEESLFGNLDQHSQVSAGQHPRSQFYGEFLGLAKAVWLLHLLAFSLDPVPCQFETSRGADFHPQFMESVIKFSGGKVPAGQIVGFPVSPGFKLGSGSIIKARVYLVSRG